MFKSAPADIKACMHSTLPFQAARESAVKPSLEEYKT